MKPGGTRTASVGASGREMAPAAVHTPGVQPAAAQVRTLPSGVAVPRSVQAVGSPAVVLLSTSPPPVSAKAAIRLLKVLATKYEKNAPLENPLTYTRARSAP